MHVGNCLVMFEPHIDILYINIVNIFVPVKWVI